MKLVAALGAIMVLSAVCYAQSGPPVPCESAEREGPLVDPMNCPSEQRANEEFLRRDVLSRLNEKREALNDLMRISFQVCSADRDPKVRLEREDEQDVAAFVKKHPELLADLYRINHTLNDIWVFEASTKSAYIRDVEVQNKYNELQELVKRFDGVKAMKKLGKKLRDGNR